MKKKRHKLLSITFIIGLVFVLNRCQPDDDCASPCEPVVNATPYTLEIPQGFPQPFIPADNPLTVEGIELGRFLFYDKKLSRDMSMSCGSCHLQAVAMSDLQPKSTGITGQQTRRHSMVLFNLAWQEKFFWDGRAMSLEEQALMPIEDPVELDNDLATVISRLEADPMYPPMFKKAFGSSKVTSERIGKAIAQFERTMVSANSEYDKVVRLGTQADFGPNPIGDPRNGMELFESEIGDCFHCHGAVETQYLFGAFGVDDQFKNNGLNNNHTADRGLGEVTNDPLDDGKFKVPSLRNAFLSAPYMHDGSIPDVDSLIEFYNSGVHANSPNLDPNMDHNGGVKRFWTDTQKKDLIAFLRTLVDYEFLSDSSFSDPFE